MTTAQRQHEAQQMLDHRSELVRRSAQRAVDHIRYVIRNSSGILCETERGDLSEAIRLAIKAMSAQDDTRIE